MSKAWIFQDSRQKKANGDKAPWSVGWIDPQGRRKSKRIGSRSNAEKYRRKLEGQLAAGTYQDESKMKWPDFRERFKTDVLCLKSPAHQQSLGYALDHFERLCKPLLIRSITEDTIDKYTALRLRESGMRGGKVSPATVNKELRNLRIAFNWALRRKLIAEQIRFNMLAEPQRHSFVSETHFAAMYEKADAATLPANRAYSAADWWQALLMLCYMTGWRIGEAMALRWDDVDLEAATATTRAEDNKGGRDDTVKLHPLVVDHLHKLQSFDKLVFFWPSNRRELYVDFHRIQKAAGIKLSCRQKGDAGHVCTAACAFYGFHDLRRAFATHNAKKMSAAGLQRLMRHRSYQTTQRYVQLADMMEDEVAALHVPKLSTVAGA